MTEKIFKLNKINKNVKYRVEEVKFSSRELVEIKKHIPNCNDFYWYDEANDLKVIGDGTGKLWKVK